MLAISVILFFFKSDLVIWAVLAFIFVTMNSIDKNNEVLNEKELIIAKKKLDITLRIFLSVSIILIIINNFFIELDTSFVLYTLILISLTSLLILTKKIRNTP